MAINTEADFHALQEQEYASQVGRAHQGRLRRVTGTFDPEDLLSLLQRLPDNAGSIVVTEALWISSDRR